MNKRNRAALILVAGLTAFAFTSGTASADQQPNPHWHWPEAPHLPVGDSGAALNFEAPRGTRLIFVIDGEEVFSIFRNRDSTYAVEPAPGILWDESGQQFWKFVEKYAPVQQLVPEEM